MRHTVRAIVPFKTRGAKTRLAPFLTSKERQAFSEAMLRDVLRSLAGTDITILATEDFDPQWDEARVQVDARGLNASLNASLASLHDPTLIVMSDIPLMREWHVREMYSDGITLVPGRGGGTNAIFVRNPARFHVDFYEVSFLKHVAIAKQCGLPLKILDSFYMSTDVDTPEDLTEVLIHCSGESCAYLRSIGVRLSYGRSRIGVERS